ncbi:hypothetical protein LTR70_005497 [Exophiala xenobiotica]|uniref:Uncharacterized protein n=1 Tax=Lithohypha guttulata TaxID=1690604 RepID=A0ABR0KDU2_9EURO|nr:hypothetical protein LTR24_003864 [Lithohypha guttulata]KAK5318354.1 hypothetical protein LTR70_005497 [Exophiala xenobiotica]
MPNRKTKQDAAVPAMFKGEYSFVNKDASNIDSKEHNAAVSWHVMNRYERWKKQEQAKKLKGLANVTANPDSSAEGSYEFVRCRPLNHQNPGRKALTKTEQGGELSSFPYPPEPWQMDQAEQSMLGQPRQPLLGGYAQAGSSSLGRPGLRPEVAISPVALSSNVSSASSSQGPLPDMTDFPPLVAGILSYAYGVMIPLTWPNEMGKGTWTYEITGTWDDLAAINEDSCYASATLCYYATLMAAVTNDKDLTLQACFFQTQAMSELRQRVTVHSGPYDPATLKSILKLFSAETALDNTSTARVHLKMLRDAVSAEGGVIQLDLWFRENLLAADCYFALKYETRPVFPASEWTPGPLSQPWKARLANARVARDHAPSIDSAVAHATLRNITSDLRELFRVERYIASHEVPSDNQLLRWRQLRKFDCISRLADHQLSVKIYPHLYLRPKLQLAICAAIALMAAMVLGSPEPVRFGLKLVTEFHGKVMDARAELGEDGPEDEDQPDPTKLIFWLLYVGMLGEKTHPVPQQLVWFEHEYLRVSGELGLDTKKDQENVAKQLLYSPALSEEVQGNRARRTQEVRRGVYEACGMSWRQPLEVMAVEE